MMDRAVRRIALPAPGRSARAAGVLHRTDKRLDWRLPVLLVALPMFAQCFQYMVDVLPLYALSKAWPILMAPLFFWGVARLDVPFKALQLVTLVWIIGVTPLVGIMQLGNDAVAALATTAKVWSYTFSFSLAALLVLLRIPAAQLRRVVLGLGWATYVIMVTLWLVMPDRVYGGGDTVSKLFMYDPERGYHIYMPMFFGMLLIFWLNRSLWLQPRLWKALAIAVAFALQYTIYKERAAIAAGMLSFAIGAALSAGRWRPVALTLLVSAGGLGGFLYLHHLQSNADFQALGGSLSVRLVSVATAWKFLSADPGRWLVGVGATTRFGNITLAQIFGNRMFFLTDIGWLGVGFEYGIIGALLMLLVYLAGLWMTARWSRRDDPLSLALMDYVVYLIAASAVYSVVFTPGELTTVLALGYYFARTRRSAACPPPVQSVRPRPRQIALASPRPSGKIALSAPSGVASKG